MIKPLISAVIVAYKSEKYINNCIDSLRESADYAKIPLEVIVVVNDKDNQKYRLSNCKVIINPKNFGFAKAANIGAKQTRGKWLLFANPDTITSKTALHELVKHQFDPKIAIIAPRHLNKDGSLQPNILCEPTLWNIFVEQSYLYKIFPKIFHHPQSDLRLYEKVHYVDVVSGSYFMIRKKVFKKLNGFDERFFMYFEDFDLCKRIRGKYKIIFEPRAGVVHFNHQSSQGIIQGNMYIDSLNRYLTKYHTRYYVYIGIVLVVLGCVLRFNYWIIKTSLTQNKELLNFGIKKITYSKEIITALIKQDSLWNRKIKPD